MSALVFITIPLLRPKPEVVWSQSAEVILSGTYCSSIFLKTELNRLLLQAVFPLTFHRLRKSKRKKKCKKPEVFVKMPQLIGL